MILIDTHCHIEPIEELIKDKLKEAKENQVGIIIISYCEKEAIEKFTLIHHTIDGVYYTLGYHPSEAKKIKMEDFLLLEKMLLKNSVIGIGEIGLDYHYGKEDKNLQIDLFKKQLALAEKRKLPVVIHSRDATLDTINILKEYRVKGIIHCFSGSLETAKEYIKMGFFLGIGGVVTFSNSNSKEVVKEIPLTSIVLETDSPYLSPVPVRGSENSSKNVLIIANYIAQLKQVSIEQLARVTNDNVHQIFDHCIKI